jgi:Ca2+-binding RTX toxin-like protein
MAGQVVYIEGLPGGFTIASVTETNLVLSGAAIQDCVIEEGSTITVYRIDTKKDSGAQVGGDHFIVGLKPGANPATSVLAGPNSPLVIYGDTSQDGSWYSGRSYDRLGQEFGDKPFDPFTELPDDQNEDNEWVFPLANPYDYAGNDIIDARALFAGVSIDALPSVGFTAYGGAGNDLIYGSQAGDHLAGGSGDDTIYGQGGSDHIYGDSGVNVNILTRELTIPTVDASPAPTIDPKLGASDQTFKPIKVRTPVRDDMAAGRDFLDGNGTSNPDQPNIIFGDHGVIKQYVDDPNLPPVLLQKIQTTNLSTVLEINSTELQNGADDILFGSDLTDLMIGGAGNDMIDGKDADDLIFGDSVYLTRRGGDDGNLLDDITSLRFQALAGTLLYSRTDRPLPTGIDPLYAYDATGLNSLNEMTSGRLLTDGIARNYRDPNGPQWWAEYTIDYADLHTFAFYNGQAGVGSFGNDYIAGGAGNDSIFGQLGHDVIQGDGSIALAVAATSHVGAGRKPVRVNANSTGIDDPVGELFVVASFEAASDGQDYIEGGGGKDVIFGGLGQDDLVGGSSSFFGLTAANSRPDSDDWITGGAGTQLARNNGFNPNAGDAPNVQEQQYGEEVVTSPLSPTIASWESTELT